MGIMDITKEQAAAIGGYKPSGPTPVKKPSLLNRATAAVGQAQEFVRPLLTPNPVAASSAPPDQYANPIERALKVVDKNKLKMRSMGIE